MEERIRELYLRVEEYAKTKNLVQVLKALPVIYEIMTTSARNVSSQAKYLSELFHCLEVCTMLIDLHIDLSSEDEDAMITAALMHIYPENFPAEDLEGKMVGDMGFSEKVFEIVDTITPGRDFTDEEQRIYYERIQENKLALLIVLADRGNVVQTLHRFSTWNAHRYIDETKACYFPMCIYGKEHYYELMAPLNVLMEKMRSLLEVGEVLLRRYEVREAELIQDILALREENATIKGIISKFKSGQ